MIMTQNAIQLVYFGRKLKRESWLQLHCIAVMRIVCQHRASLASNSMMAVMEFDSEEVIEIQ